MDQSRAIAVILFVILFPIAMSLVIVVAGRVSEKLRDVLALVTSAVTFLLTVYLYSFVAGGNVVQHTFFEIMPRLEISIRLDLLSFGLTVLASFVWFLCTLYSIDYMAGDHASGRYYTVLLFTLGSCLGIFLAGDFFTMFIFFELMSLIAYVLVVHEETEQALKAGFKYLVMVIIGGLALFFGIVIIFELVGTEALGVGVLIEEGSVLAVLVFVSFLIGFGMKAGMFPLHIWLPDAHPVAPSPASALLSGVMLKTGAYGLFRVIFHVFSNELIFASHWNTVLGVLAVITIFLGSAVALTQDDIKRRLAYSSIGQMGYILLGLSIMNENAVTGAIFHMYTHAFMKSALFLAAGAVIWKTGIRNVSDMGGIGRRMPITMVCFSIAALALIGIPPLSGFVSKWVLVLGSLDAHITIYALVLLVSSMLNALYYLPIIVPAFFKETSQDSNDTPFDIQEVPPRMLAPIIILALSAFLFGLLPTNVFYDLSRATAIFLLGMNP
ncbi:MAG TPA: monovalent cation/H+ antiporter subunit D family protein [Bacteroidales bacterium]|nr:monovalent cation/H+ antiporter subunit D family protein [Bacteroidales bacterium]